MQSRNLILAIVLSMAVMFGWTILSQEMGWTPSPEDIAARQEQQTKQLAEQKAAGEIQADSEQKTQPAVSNFTPAPGKDVIIETPLYTATIYSGGAILRSFELKHYNVVPEKEPWFTIFGFGIGLKSPFSDQVAPKRINLVDPLVAKVAPLGLLVNGLPSWSTGKWSFDGENINVESGEKTLEFIGEVDGLRVTRALTFSAHTYEIKEKISILTLGDQARSVRLGYSVAEDKDIAAGGYYDALRVAWGIAGEYNEETDDDLLTSPGLQVPGNISWVAATSTYFMSAITPQINTQANAEVNTGLTLKARKEGEVYRVVLEQSDIAVAPKALAEQNLSYWVGPKVARLLEQAPNDLKDTIDLGMFGFIGKILLWCLEYLYNFSNNWGVAIILLTIGIKAIFWPLTAKSYASMAKMRKIQPIMLAMREKYADDREALTRETMALYKTHGVNPASGCVPILVQLPVFFGLYQALLTSIELRGASFITYFPGTDALWLADLSQADPFYITPIIMGISMYFMQKMSPPMGDPMQQKIMMFLPLIFTFMFLTFPSGLVLYWLVNNLLSMLQQWLLLKRFAK